MKRPEKWILESNPVARDNWARIAFFRDNPVEFVKAILPAGVEMQPYQQEFLEKLTRPTEAK